MDSDSSRCVNQESILHDESSRPHNLALQYLKEITNNFCDEQVLGEGGFGVVYKGVLQNGEIIAVKKIVQSKPSSQKQFENEIDLLMRLKHPNIVRLVGYCCETQKLYTDYNGKNVFAEMTESLVCLEYLPNGSLDRYLSDESSGLDWHTRYKIIEGICHGLHYLHEQVHTPIIHLDLKPANILLDGNMDPKITDFGLSRLLDQQQTIHTLIANGTRGYMPPEYLQGGTITPMSDIFSLGVIILEVITGHRNYPEVTITSSGDFTELVLEKWRNRLDKSPGYTSLEISCQQIKSCIEIGLICVNPVRTKRPTSLKIIKMLQGLESTDCHINEVTSEVKSDPRELLLAIHPLELCFRSELNKWIRCLAKLTNKTDDYVAFCFARNNYRIEPDLGIVYPRSTFNVIVTIEDQEELQLGLLGNGESLVQSIVVREDRRTPMHITGDLFDMSSNVFHRVILTVDFVPQTQPPCPLHVGSKETNTSDAQQLEDILLGDNEEHPPQLEKVEGDLIRSDAAAEDSKEETEAVQSEEGHIRSDAGADDSEEGHIRSDAGADNSKEEAEAVQSEAKTEEMDTLVDEFIKKFYEQLRLQHSDSFQEKLPRAQEQG